MSGVTSPPQPLPTLQAAQLAETPPEQRWLIESLWVEQAVGVIGGTPKSCKTFLGLEMAFAIATGTPCLGRYRVHHSGPTLLFLAEDSLADVRERLQALADHRQLDLASAPVHVITVPTLRLDVAPDIARLAATVAALRPRLLLLDPLVRLHRADENNSGDIAAILARLRALQRRFGVAIALVHHARKQVSSRQPGQSLRGSGDIHAWVDSLLYLLHDRFGLQLTAEHRAAPAPQPVYLELEHDPLHLAIVTKAQDPPSLTERVLVELADFAEPITRTRLRQRLAVNNQRLGDALAELERLGRIQRSADGWTR